MTDVSFDLQPTLTGSLVVLRPMQPADFAALYGVASDPLIWAQHPESNRHEEPVFRRFFQSGLDSGGAFVVLDRANGRIIGSSRFHAFDAASREVEIGWTFLARSHWGGRFNAEMKRLMLAHAFPHVDRVLFIVGPRNVRSQRAVERIGAVRAGVRTNERGEESLVYEITPDAFERFEPLRSAGGGA
jgi:RimJ/RimL family protein N-acetyltransferase